VKEPRWLDARLASAIHAELMSEFGGLGGPAKGDLLEAALARPKHRLVYETPRPGLHELAASYGFAFARNHCFPDGNKRVALAAIDVFLQLNGRELVVDEMDAVVVIRELAAGEIDEATLAAWIRANSVKLRAD
jgi:death on curing protein